MDDGVLCGLPQAGPAVPEHRMSVIVNVETVREAYAVASSGGAGEMLCAIPWNTTKYDTDDKCFHLDVTGAHVKGTPGFDGEHWRVMAQSQWGLSLHQYYNSTPYWLT